MHNIKYYSSECKRARKIDQMSNLRTAKVSSSKIKHDLYDVGSVVGSATDHSNLNTVPV